MKPKEGRQMTNKRLAIIQGVTATSQALIEKWLKQLQILEGKTALGITLSAKESQDLAFYRAFLIVARDRQQKAA
jgi:hypothetical protein